MGCCNNFHIPSHTRCRINACVNIQLVSVYSSTPTPSAHPPCCLAMHHSPMNMKHPIFPWKLRQKTLRWIPWPAQRQWGACFFSCCCCSSLALSRVAGRLTGWHKCPHTQGSGWGFVLPRCSSNGPRDPNGLVVNKFFISLCLHTLHANRGRMRAK